MDSREAGYWLMDVPHKNYDPVFKEALVLFKDKTLDFLGLTGIAPIEESLSTENVEIEINWDFKDLAFSTKDGGGVHLEEEVDLSQDDLLRFGGYNISLRRVHKREFVTVIFVKNPTSLTGIHTEHLIFKPIIVQCSEIDADAILGRLKRDIAAGNPINELELVYLPLFRSAKLSPTELFLESTGLIKALQVEDNLKRKIFSLALVLAGKVVDDSVLDEVYREVRTMSNKIIEYAESYGAKLGAAQREEEIAKKMLSKGMDILDVMEVTGLSAERIREIRDSVHGESVSA